MAEFTLDMMVLGSLVVLLFAVIVGGFSKRKEDHGKSS